MCKKKNIAMGTIFLCQEQLLSAAIRATLFSMLPVFTSILLLIFWSVSIRFIFFFQAEDGIRELYVTGVQTCALPISVTAGGAHCVRRASRDDSRAQPILRDRAVAVQLAQPASLWHRTVEQQSAERPGRLLGAGRAGPAGKPTPARCDFAKRDVLLDARMADADR